MRPAVPTAVFTAPMLEKHWEPMSPARRIGTVLSISGRFLPAIVLFGFLGMVACTPRAVECTGAATTPDLSGCERTGIASFYADKFAGREMADGARMDPNADNAASRTLPLGTRAKVTNLETGRSAEVTIQDRGPYVNGRIIDLSPATAREIGLDPKQGIARVVVAPIEVPLPDGGVKKGAAFYVR